MLDDEFTLDNLPKFAWDKEDKKLKGLCHKCYGSNRDLFIYYGRILCDRCKDE